MICIMFYFSHKMVSVRVSVHKWSANLVVIYILKSKDKKFYPLNYKPGLKLLFFKKATFDI